MTRENPQNRGVAPEPVEAGSGLTHDAEAGDLEAMTTPATSKRTPAFQFYPSDFLSSSKVDRMSLTERGAYITLLSRCWLDNGLPTDTKTLAAMLHVKAIQFDRMWSGPLHECFYEKNGKLHNPRLDAERKKQREYRQRQSENGKLGGRPRKPTANPEEAVGSFGLSDTKPKESSSSSSSFASTSSEEQEHSDVLFAQFLNAYPSQGRRAGPLVEQMFLGALSLVGESELFAALENHVLSEQWSVAKKIPAMDKWFRERRWLQRLDPPKSKSPWGDWASKEAM